jgi:hypothetical protein
MDITNNRSHWVIYCKSAVSIAEFLESYGNIDEFYKFTNSFLLNEHTKLALPLLISAEVFGFGFALACDFIKDNVSPDFVKPDVHINEIAFGLGISQSKNDFDVFKDMIRFCQSINQKPCEVDKLFWLIGSGDFYLNQIEINSSRNEFIRRCLSGVSD